jgi:glycerophosphoryl diester phosphodiesterase
MKTVKTSEGQIIFAFTDSDYEVKKETFAEMKQFAKDNYKKEYQNDILFSAFHYNNFYNCSEPIDGIRVNSKTSQKDYNKFKSRIIQEYGN